MTRVRPAVAALAGLLALGGVTWLLRVGLGLVNPTIAALTFVLIVVVVAARASRLASTAISITAFAAFNYFFLPPVGTWTIADPQNWVALFTLLVVSLVVGHLASVARAQTLSAEQRRAETLRLFDFSRDVLLVTDDRESLVVLTRSLCARYRFDGAMIALRTSEGWERHFSGIRVAEVPDDELTRAWTEVGRALQFDARERAYSGQTNAAAGTAMIRLVPIRRGTDTVGLLGVTGDNIDAGPLDTLAGLAAIAVERVTQSEARRHADVQRERAALSSALLSAMAHDLRTPLTAIRVAAENLGGEGLPEPMRHEQAVLIRDEASRLHRLFENILEMARIDVGGVSSSPTWTFPSEVVDGARALVGPRLREHEVRVHVEADRAVLIDPRLVATALAHVLENAAKYAPPGTPIDVEGAASSTGVTFDVRDYGPGIPPSDVSRVFEPFYRGQLGSGRTTGTGMGLAIARGLLAAAGGRIWCESASAQGTHFRIVVQGPVRDEAAIAPSEDAGQ